jgi:tRNA threonylcarbamoyladenosine biosynthesis protein TsaE
MNFDKTVETIIKTIPQERIFLLIGTLGAGKTTLTKAIARQLKIKEVLNSPTFILWQKYNFFLKNKRLFLNHLDIYRLKAQDILKLGLKKELNNKDNIFFIEWGEKLKPFLKKNKIKFVEIIINKKNNGRREFIVK